MILNKFIDYTIRKDIYKQPIKDFEPFEINLSGDLSNLKEVLRQYESELNTSKLHYEAFLKAEYIAITINDENNFMLDGYIRTWSELGFLSLEQIPFFISGENGKTCIYKLAEGITRDVLLKNTLSIFNLSSSFILPHSIVNIAGKNRAYSLVVNSGLDIKPLAINRHNNLNFVQLDDNDLNNFHIANYEYEDSYNNDNELYEEYAKMDIANIEQGNTKHNIEDFIKFLKMEQVTIISNKEYTLYLKQNKSNNITTENAFLYSERIREAFNNDVYISKDYLNSNAYLLQVISSECSILKDGKKTLNNKLDSYKIDLVKLLDASSKIFKQFAVNIPSILFISKGSYNYEQDADKELYEITYLEDSAYINLFDNNTWEEPKKIARSGDWSFIKAHLENLTEGEEGTLDYILYLYALKMQKPNATFDTNTICILDNGGTGKSLLGKILNYIQCGNGEFQLFNKDRTQLIGKRYMYINEMVHNKEFTTELKKVTENFVWSERKYKNPTLIKHSALFHLFSNKANILDYEESRRRWIILNPKTSLKDGLLNKFSEQDTNRYLEQLGALGTTQLNLDFIHSQLNAFIDYLLNYDLSVVPARTLTKATKQSNSVLNSSRVLEYLDEVGFSVEEVSRYTIEELNTNCVDRLYNVINTKSNRTIDMFKLNQKWTHYKIFKLDDNNNLELLIEHGALLNLVKKMFNTNEKTALNHIDLLLKQVDIVKEATFKLNGVNMDGYRISLTGSIYNK